MEGPPNAIRFDQTHDTRFFLCRHCRNHVLSLDTCLVYVVGADGRILCKNPVNVRVDHILFRWLHDHQPVATVACNACNRNLGRRHVIGSPANNVIQEGIFIFYTNQMLYWDGTQLVYADTLMPVDN